jgi:hypothetical protein
VYWLSTRTSARQVTQPLRESAIRRSLCGSDVGAARPLATDEGLAYQRELVDDASQMRYF